MNEILIVVAVTVFLLNIPFGYWRANVRKLSLEWLAAIHLPVPAVVLLRVISGLGWRAVTFPALVGSFFLGQYLGVRIHRLRSRQEGAPLTSCLVMDLVRSHKSR